MMTLTRGCLSLISICLGGFFFAAGCSSPTRTFGGHGGSAGSSGESGAVSVSGGGSGGRPIEMGGAPGDAGSPAGGSPDENAGASPLSDAGAAGAPDVAPCGGAKLDTDPKNCGECGNNCDASPNLMPGATGITCKAGVCVIPDSACAVGKKHCSTKADDVCETDVTTSAQCGACGAKCDSAQVCAGGTCADNCAAGATKCTAGQSVGCYLLASSADHCGACATACPAPPSNGTAACQTSACKVLCSNNYHQCNASPQCEADSDVNHCGPTCKRCETTDPNAKPICSNNTCSYPCNTGYQFCGFCISKNDANNCGSCGNVCGSSKTCSNGSCVDTIAPTIISVTPADGVTKLTPSTDTIVITFSEPMDKLLTQSAFTANSGTPALSWNAAGTELTIDPKVPYPSATDPAAAATPYKYTLSTGAKDAAGNSLASPLSRQFSLLREITQQCPYSYGGNLDSAQNVPYQFSGTFVAAGDITANRSFRGFMSFDISGLPNGVQTFESATLGASIVQLDGNPFVRLGDLLIHSVAFSAINATAYNASIRFDLGTFVAASGTHAKNDVLTKDVLTALKSDYLNRVALLNQTQYRIQFSTAVYADSVADQVWIFEDNGTLSLTVKYLFP